MVRLNCEEIESWRNVRSFTRREIVSAAGLPTQLDAAFLARLEHLIPLWFGRAQSIERLGDVLDANAVLDNPEIVIADGSDDCEICGNCGHHQKINH